MATVVGTASRTVAGAQLSQQMPTLPSCHSLPASHAFSTPYCRSGRDLACGYSSGTFFASESLHSFVARPVSGHQRRRGSNFLVYADADYYATLGVGKDANKSDIKSAYRKLARQYHPDVNKDAGAEQKFKDISNAYEVLSDDEKRSIYDRFGEAGLKGQGAGAGDYGSPFDLFESLFGGMGGMGGMGGAPRSRATQGDDSRYDLTLEFKDAIFGVEKEIKVTQQDQCKTCSGSGAKAGSIPRKCSACDGQGQVLTTAQTPLGMFQQVTTCSSCEGEGETSSPCSTCRGDGRVKIKNKKISLKIPAGVDNGSRLRVRSEGNAGRKGGPPGDLYVFINVKSDAELKRDGNNIYVSAKISYTDAILGTTVKVPTVDGTVDLRIPAGIQPGSSLVMAKRGVPFMGKPTIRGDQLVRVQVEIPSKLSKAERELIEELKEMTQAKIPVGATR